MGSMTLSSELLSSFPDESKIVRTDINHNSGEYHYNYSASEELFSSIDVCSSTASIMSLTHVHNACVTGIFCDMWIGIEVTKEFRRDDGMQCDYVIGIEGDNLEHCLLASILVLEEIAKNEST